MNLKQFLSLEELDKLRYWWPYIPRWRRRFMRLYAQIVLTVMRFGHACLNIVLVEYPAHWIEGGTDDRIPDPDPVPAHRD